MVSAPFSTRSDTPCPARINAGCGLARLVRRTNALATRLSHMPERVGHAVSSSSNCMSAGSGSAHRRGGCNLMTFADLLVVIIGAHQGFFRRLNDNRV